MRKEKTFEIEIEKGLKKEITVYEVCPLSLIKSLESIPADDRKNFSAITDVMFPHCCDMKKEEFLKLYPTDQGGIFAAFKEVNTFFLETIERFKKLPVISYWADQMIQGFHQDLISFFGKQLAGLSEQDTEDAVNTDGDSL